jgi:hypothetical protein|tara:strand:+ start:39 stop:173 length:135 start_codon:yes stop_codon:yes gene_type:complete
VEVVELLVVQHHPLFRQLGQEDQVVAEQDQDPLLQELDPEILHQ